MTDRFYIDERGGCIAVRDREKDDEWARGLHASMEGVMAYWTGFPDYDDKGMMRWNLHDWQCEKAESLCAELNTRHITRADIPQSIVDEIKAEALEDESIRMLVNGGMVYPPVIQGVMQHQANQLRNEEE